TKEIASYFMRKLRCFIVTEGQRAKFHCLMTG
ncbi:unnamed protein product, partial [Rotaria sp. Silwood2]